MKQRILEIIPLAVKYIEEGYSEVEAVRKAEKEVREKENNKYGICC